MARFALPSFKRLTRRPAVRAALCWLGARYIRFVHATSRWEVVGGETPASFWARKEPFILAFWHGRLMMMPFAWRQDAPVRVLISHHADGEFLSRMMRYFAIGTIRGSSRKGGAAALRALVRLLAEGVSVGFTPDGPRGPRMRAGDGVVALARMSGAAILPVVYSTSRRRVLGSWDRFLLALPFGRGVFLWGEPIRIARDAKGEALEGARRALEDALNGLAAEADRRTGHAPVEPAAPEAPAAAAAPGAP